MERKEQNKKSLKPRRVFSEQIRKQIVQDIEKNKCSVLEASRELGVHFQTIYNWIYRYSRYLSKNKIMVVEDKSESYRSKELEKQIKELEAALGRKQMEIDLLNKIIELASEKFQTDIKKNLQKSHLNGTGLIKVTNTDTK
jgi:transposase